MANEGIKLTGNVKVELIRDGEVVLTRENHNIITTAGKNALAALLNSASAGTSIVSHMGFGTGSTTPAIGDTTLTTELTIGTNGYARVAVARSVASNVITYTATLTGITATTTIQEVGLFNQAATGGTLFAHYLTGAVALSSSSDSLQITWQITFS